MVNAAHKRSGRPYLKPLAYRPYLVVEVLVAVERLCKAAKPVFKDLDDHFMDVFWRLDLGQVDHNVVYFQTVFIRYAGQNHRVHAGYYFIQGIVQAGVAEFHPPDVGRVAFKGIHHMIFG